MCKTTLILIFENARNVVKAEALCRQAHLDVRVLPVPEHLSSECGLCLEIKEDLLPQFTTLASMANIPYTTHA